MKHAVTILLASLMLAGGATLGEAKNPKAFKPAQLPAAQDRPANISATMAPAGAMMAAPAPKAPAMNPQQMIDSLVGLKGSKDGSQTVVQPPKRVQDRLMRQEGMIGDDKNKKKKTDTGKLTPVNSANYPYTTMGVIASGCTGTLVMKKFVLTAAWCVYDVKAKKFYENLNFFPAASGKNAPFGEIPWKNAWVAKDFSEKGDLAFAYGLIELDQDVGDQAGWFGFGNVPNFNFKQLTLTGYPLDGASPLAAVEAKCAVAGAQDSAIFYSCPGDAKQLQGMIGSPVWFKGKADDAWQIVGIHVTSQDNTMKGWWASRLNQASTDTLVAWASGTDQTDQGTDDQTDDQTTDEGTDEGTDDTADNNPPCTCEDQGSAQ